MIKDSGTRMEFDTGAVRDIQEGKGRCDLLPLKVVADTLWMAGEETGWEILNELHKYQTAGGIECLFETMRAFINERFDDDVSTAILEVSKHFEAGAKKYGERNWEKGIPESSYIDSAVRHYLKWLRGDDDEPHDRAFLWNIMCLIWTHENITIKCAGAGLSTVEAATKND